MASKTIARMAPDHVPLLVGAYQRIAPYDGVGRIRYLGDWRVLDRYEDFDVSGYCVIADLSDENVRQNGKHLIIRNDEKQSYLLIQVRDQQGLNKSEDELVAEVTKPPLVFRRKWYDYESGAHDAWPFPPPSIDSGAYMAVRDQVSRSLAPIRSAIFVNNPVQRFGKNPDKPNGNAGNGHVFRWRERSVVAYDGTGRITFERFIRCATKNAELGHFEDEQALVEAVIDATLSLGFRRDCYDVVRVAEPESYQPPVAIQSREDRIAERQRQVVLFTQRYQPISHCDLRTSLESTTELGIVAQDAIASAFADSLIATDSRGMYFVTEKGRGYF